MYKRCIVFTVSVALLVLWFSPASAQMIVVSYFFQNDFNLTGKGARAAGMGNAFIAVADDATAISWNPAGLSQLKSMEASVVGRTRFCSIDLSVPSTISASAGAERESVFGLNFASLAFPFKLGDKEAVGCIAFQRFIDLDEILKTELTFYGDTDQREYESKGNINIVSPGLGIQINEQLSVGAAFNIITGTNESTSKRAGTITDEDEDKYSGSFFSLGVLFRLDERITIGGQMSTGFTIKDDNKDKDSGLSYDLEIDIPALYAIGVAYRASDVLTLAGDYRIRSLSDVEIANKTTGVTLEDLYEDVNSLHLGAEYIWQSGETIIPLRAGFYTNPKVFSELDINSATGYGDQVKGYVLTAGFGVVTGSFIFDVAYEYGALEYDTGWTFDSEFNSLGPVVHEGSESRLTVGAVMHFGSK